MDQEKQSQGHMGERDDLSNPSRDGGHGNESDGGCYDDGCRQREEKEVLTMNVLLLGGPQTGKSSVGNALLGSLEFPSSLSAGCVTREPKLRTRKFPEFLRRQGEVTALRLQVMDTPAIPNPVLSEDVMVASALERFSGRGACTSGVHVLVLVLRVDVPLGQEVKSRLTRTAEAVLGPDWRSHTMLVLTHADRLQGSGVSQAQCLQEGSLALQELLKTVENRFQFVDVYTGWGGEEGRKLRETILQLSVRNRHTSLPVRHIP